MCALLSSLRWSAAARSMAVSFLVALRFGVFVVVSGAPSGMGTEALI